MQTPVDFSYEEIAPLIRVYKNLLPSHADLVKTLDKMVEINSDNYLYDTWADWFIFGKYTQLKSDFLESNTKFDKNFFDQFLLYKITQESSRIAISHYVASYNVPLPQKLLITDVSLAYYHPDVDITNNNSGAAMYPHSDYVAYEEGWPGEKFFITQTIYLNDNYDAGEIYYVFKDQKITYKPNAGEIIVFPSGAPLWPGNCHYFHGVNTPKNGRKYLLRCYLKYVSDASQEWIDGVKQHGEEEWKKICIKKLKHKTPVETWSLEEQKYHKKAPQ